MEFCLIQRVNHNYGNVPTPSEVGNDSAKTFDAVYGLDYMGRAEFEFGTPFRALKTILANHTKGSPVVKWNTKIKNRDGKDIFVVSGEDLKHNDEILAFLKHQLTFNICDSKCDYKKYRWLKERTNIREALGECDEKTAAWGEKHVVWWDLENNFFICRDKTEANRLWYTLVNTFFKFKDEGKI